MGIFGKSKEEKKLEDCRKLAEETLSVFRNADVESSVASLIIKLMKEKTKVCKNSLYSSDWLEQFIGEGNIFSVLDEMEKLLTSDEKKDLIVKLCSEFPRVCDKSLLLEDNIPLGKILFVLENDDDTDALDDLNFDLNDEDDDSKDSIDLDSDELNLDLDEGDEKSEEGEIASELEEKLAKLKKLYEKGLISEADYNKKKDALLEDL